VELIYIEWDDASAVDAETGWVDIDSAPEPVVHIIRQVGFVTAIDLEALILTDAYGPHGMDPRTRIPLGMIRRWVDLDAYVKANP